MSRQASKRVRHRQRSCKDKTRFGSGRSAAGAAIRHGLTFYRCPSCRGYHLTKERA